MVIWLLSYIILAMSSAILMKSIIMVSCSVLNASLDEMVLTFYCILVSSEIVDRIIWYSNYNNIKSYIIGNK